MGGFAAASTALLAAGVSTVFGAGAAAADNAQTQGSSSAQSMWVGPHEGSLAIGALFGVALAGNTGNSAKAESQGVDLGAVGEAMETDNCNQPPKAASLVPQPLIVESGETGADQGISQGPSKTDYFANEYGLANDSPYSEADTTYGGPVADPTNAVSISGMHAKAWSGVVNGVNEAGASSDISSLSLGGGAVVLNGLHWLSVTPTNGGGQQTGSFSVGQVLIGGNAIPTTDLSAVATAVNEVLGQLGMQVNFPVAQVEQGIQFVSPLQIEVVPDTARDSAEAPIVNGAQPTYYQIANGLENGFSSDSPPYNNLGTAESNQAGQQIAAALCQSDTPITVADVTIASLDGGGYFSTELGGVNSSDGSLASNPFTLGLASIGLASPGTSTLTAGSLGTPGDLGSLGGMSGGPVGSSTASSPPNSGSSAKLHAEAARAGLHGLAAGGPLLGAGLGALALLVGLVEGDRQLMRRAQKAAASVSAGSPESAST
jgi:hypothetical protein